MKYQSKLYFDFALGKFLFSINKNEIIESNLYNSIIHLLKNIYFCKYNPKNHSWEQDSPIVVQSMIDDIKSYVTVFISKEDNELLEDMIYPKSKELKKVKVEIDNSFFEKFPPLIGKKGFETYQIDAIKQAILQNRLIFDISTRHGKTYIICAALDTLWKNNFIDRIFIVCRPEGIENFKLEILRFLPELFTENDIGIVTTDQREIENFFDKKIIITNYKTFQLTGKYYSKLRSKSKNSVKMPRKKSIKFDSWGDRRIIILDEGQSINNYGTLQSHFLHLYKDFFERRIVMSGTIGFDFLHYYSHCKFLVPDMIPYSYSEWTSYIANKGTYYSDYVINSLKEERVKEFKERVIDKIQISYRDCLNVTEHEKEIIYVGMTEKMKNIYRDFIELKLNQMQKDKDLVNKTFGGKTILTKFPYLVQFTSDPSLVIDKEKNWKLKDNPKIEIIESLLEKHIKDQNQKVILWSVHPKILNGLKEIFKKYDPYIIHGDEETSIKKEERISYLNEFKKDRKSKLLLASPLVLQTSISLIEVTAQIYYDLVISNDVLKQSMDRFHGPMQQNKVKTYFLLFNKSIDIYIWNEILERKERIKNVLSTKEQLTIDDFRDIFNSSKEKYQIDY